MVVFGLLAVDERGNQTIAEAVGKLKLDQEIRHPLGVPTCRTIPERASPRGHSLLS
jgi:hypothetical protein